MTQQEYTGAPNTTSPGAIVFIDEPTEGFTEDEIYSMFSSSGELVTMDEVYAANDGAVGVTAAADVQTGAMVALVPAGEFLADLVVPNGEPEEILHLTLLYLGDAASFDDQMRQDIKDGVAFLADRQPVVEAEAFSVAVFNPLGEEPCVVLLCGGESLQDVFMSVCAEVDRAEAEYPEMRMPWIPHVTLKYLNPGDDVNLSDYADRTKVMLFDRLRVAFAGEVTDYPLVETLVSSAAWPFHLAGQHNQQTHGRGGASPGEIGAAERLNKGKKLDLNDPEQARLHGAIVSWADGGNDGSTLRHEMELSAGPNGDPSADTAGASFMRTIASAPADAPELHRGMAHVREGSMPREGDVFELGPTSFTRSTKVRDRFAMHTSDDYGVPTTVHVKLKKGSRSLRIDQELEGTSWAGEQEHVALGKFRVTKYKESRTKVPTKIGKKKEVILYEIEIEQVPDTLESTTVTTKSPIESDEWYGN